MATSKRSRGPTYPGFSLEQAVEAIGKIDRLYGKNTMTRGEAGAAMGFSERSGHTMRWVSTLSQYGLLERRGTGKVGVTSLAKDVLFPPSSDDEVSVVTDALTRPVVFADLLKSFPNPALASQEIVVSKLRSGVFTEASARSAARVFVDSVVYLEKVKANARFDRADESSTEDRGGTPVDDQVQPELGIKDQDGRGTYEGFEELCLVPLSPVTSVRILIKGPLGPAEFDVLSQVLAVHRLALVGDSDSSQHSVPQVEARRSE